MINVYVLINRLIDLTMKPMERVHPMVPLALWSVVVGVFAMIIYKYTSKQDGIKDAKEKIKGHFYEVWLFIDDAAVIAKAQGRIMWNALRYLGYALPPLAIMIVIFFPLFANFETRYAFHPVRPGDEVLVKVRLSEGFEGWEDAVELDVPPGMEKVGPRVRLVRRIMESESSLREKAREYEVDYRLRPRFAGRYDLLIKVKGESFTVPLYAGDEPGKRSAPLATDNLGHALLFPPLVTLPAGAGVAEVEIEYGEAEFPFLGWETWWVWPFLIISMIAALAVKGVFKVEI